MATTNASPTSVVADAIAALTKTLNAVLARTEEETRLETARAVAETREALRERDEIRKTLHEYQLEEQAWKQEEGVWKSAVDKVEMVNKHQTETISQLRQEARQWKDQCLRLEETSRDWKEQFLRVEQERQILLSRIDELVAEKLLHASQASFYTNSKHNETTELSTSPTTTKGASASLNPFQTNSHKSVFPLSPTEQESPSEVSQRNARPTQRSKGSRVTSQRDAEVEHCTPSYPAKGSTRTQTQKSLSARIPRYPVQAHNTSRSQQRTASSPTRIVRQEMRSEPRQQVIRRVTATFELPVKKEDVEDDEREDSASGSPDDSPTTRILNARKTRSSQHKSRQQSKRSIQADDDDSYVEDDIDEEDEAHSHASCSEEDDELMMGAEENRKEVYGTHRVAATPVRLNGTSRASGSSGKKRKQAVGRVSGGSATKARRL